MKKKNINWGDFRNNTPVSNDYGFDRGKPVDRYYIERFLEKNAGLIKGNCLELMDTRYIEQFGQSKVTSYDVLDIDIHNKRATIIADLTAKKKPLKKKHYDCIIFTQALQLMYDVKIALKNLCYALKPGGYLFITAPFIAKYEQRYPMDCWRFTEDSMNRLLLKIGKNINFEIESYGNLITCIAFLEGLAVEDLKKTEFKYKDPAYPLIICAKVHYCPN